MYVTYLMYALSRIPLNQLCIFTAALYSFTLLALASLHRKATRFIEAAVYCMI